VDDAGNITQNRKQNVDQQVRAAATFEKDTKRWQNDGEDDLYDVAAGESHDCCLFWSGLRIWSCCLSCEDFV